MTRGAFFFKRAGPKTLVTAPALLVNRIGPFRDFLIAFIQFMAFTARLGLIVFIFSKRVMTVPAGQSISADIVMFFVLKYDISRSDFKLQPDRFMGRFGRKRRVAQNPHEQKINDQTVCQL
jgi:hypothetical protein